jgi:nicotinamidase-related amidase
MTTDTRAPIDPAKTALLVMDYQNGIFERIDDSAVLLAGAKQTIALIRDHGGHVGYVRVGFADGEAPSGTRGRRIGREAALTMFHADSLATQIDDEIAPQDGDIVVRKTRVGPFGTTDLHEQLQARGIDTLILGGISTSGVVLSTVRDAHDRDYRLIVLSDLCADPEADVHTFLVERIFPRQGEVITSAELYDLLHERQPRPSR